MKNNWPVKKLGEVAEFQSGFAIAKTKSIANGVSHLRTFNIDTSGKLNLSQLVHIPEKLVNKNGFGLKKGDILFNNTNSKELVGKSSIVEKDLAYAFSNHLTRIRVNSKKIEPEWVLLILINLWQKGYFLHQSVKWIGQAGFSVEKLKNLEIPVPGIEEQRRIVKNLKKILAKIEKTHTVRKESIDDTAVLRSSIKSSVFKDLLKNRTQELMLEEVTTLITDGTHYTPKYTGTGIPFLSVKNIREDGFLLDDIKYISDEEHKILTKRCKPKKDDVIYTKVGTTGIAKVIDIDLDFSIFVSLALLRVDKNKIKPKYLETALNSPLAKSQAEMLTRGMANKNLVIKDIKKIKIPVPDLKEQERVVEYLDGLSEKVQALQKFQQEQLQELKLLKQSVLHRAFRGAIK